MQFPAVAIEDSAQRVIGHSGQDAHVHPEFAQFLCHRVQTDLGCAWLWPVVLGQNKNVPYGSIVFHIYHRSPVNWFPHPRSDATSNPPTDPFAASQISAPRWPRVSE